MALVLEQLPRIDETLRRGRGQLLQVRAMTRVATPTTRPCCCSTPCTPPPRSWNGSSPASADSSGWRIRSDCSTCAGPWACAGHWDEDGMLIIHGRLAPEDGALLLKAVNAMKDRIYREEREAREERGEQETSGPPQPDPVEGGPLEGATESPAGCRQRQRRCVPRSVDALLRLVETGMQAEPKPLTGGERTRWCSPTGSCARRRAPFDRAAGHRTPAHQASRCSTRPRGGHKTAPPPGPATPPAGGREITSSRPCPSDAGPRPSHRAMCRALTRPTRLAASRNSARGAGWGMPITSTTWADGGETSLENLVAAVPAPPQAGARGGLRLRAGRRTAGSASGPPDGGLLPEAFRLKLGHHLDLRGSRPAVGPERLRGDVQRRLGRSALGLPLRPWGMSGPRPPAASICRPAARRRTGPGAASGAGGTFPRRRPIDRHPAGEAAGR
ncbi:MAG: hypothetical protein U5R48_08450 [Gammaproteobacteria bacterium]|nr:hypothetical protein [Gammaproteobacteria bacterium]